MVKIVTVGIMRVRYQDELAAVAGEFAPISTSSTVVRNEPDRRNLYTDRESTREDIILYWKDPDHALTQFLGDSIDSSVSFEVPDEFIEDKNLTDGIKVGDCSHCDETVLQGEEIRGAFGSLFCCMMCLNEGEATYG